MWKRALTLCCAIASLSAPAVAAPRPRPESAPPVRFGRDSLEVARRLGAADFADVGKACGLVVFPWGYRGEHGRELAARTVQWHRADGPWATRFARLLLGAASLDSASRMAPIRVNCDTVARSTVYAVRLSRAGAGTTVVIRFDQAAALVFDEDRPLGTIALGTRADSIWSALAQVMSDDPPLRGARPRLEPAPPLPWAEWADTLPEPVERAYASYPDRARDRGVSGLVWVAVLVDREGTIRDAFVLSGPPELRDASLDAVWQWRFQPARHAGSPVSLWVSIPFRFTLH